MKQKKENLSWWIYIFCFMILFGANILFNAWICEGARVFYDDDLGCVLGFVQEEKWWNCVFTTSAQKIRPVAMGIIYFVLQISKDNYEIIDITLLFLNFLNCVLVFIFLCCIIKTEKKIEKIGMALICGILFGASRFAYYNISEVFGIMEGVGILLALTIQLCLILYIENKETKPFYIAVVMYAAILYTHERYFVLIVLFIIAVVIKKICNNRKDYKLLFWPAVLCITFWVLRIILFGSRAMDGTGGTDIKETFRIIDVLKFSFSQIGYLLGFQCGPAYLSGINALHVDLGITTLLCIRLLAIIGVLMSFIGLLVVEKNFRVMHLWKFIMSMAFIVLCIGSSSITIRVEMRWIYVSYAMFLILLFYMSYAVFENYHISQVGMLCLLIFCSITIVTETYYREHYNNLYYWTTKDLSRELYNSTVERYGKDLAQKEIIIVSQQPYFADKEEEDWKRFFSLYVDSSNLNVLYVNNTLQAQANRKGNSIVIVEDLIQKEYIDITEILVKDDPSNLLQISKIYGIYDDLWCEPDCSVSVNMSGGKRVNLIFFYPEELEKIGQASGAVLVNGEIYTRFEMPTNLLTVEVELLEQENTIQILSDFWVYENTDRSADGRLSYTLHIEGTE